MIPEVAATAGEMEENEMDAEDRGQGREEGLQYYRTLAKLPFGSLYSYTCSRVYLSHQFEIYFTLNHYCIHTY